MMEVKGGMIRDLPKYVKENFGEEKYNEWYNSLPEESQQIYSQQILASVWYPYEYASQIPNNLIVKMFYNGDPKRAKEMGEYSANKALKGIYKIFLKLLSVGGGGSAVLIDKMQQMMSAFVRPVKVEEGESSKDPVTGINKFVMRIIDYPGITEAEEYSVAGWAGRALEIMGGTDVDVQIPTSLARGDDHTDIVMIWKQ